MSINWALGVNQTNPIDTFRTAFDQGRAQRREREGMNALAAYAQNPNEQGLAGLATVNPMLALQERSRMAQGQQQAQQDERAQLEKRLQIVGQAAQWADTPEKWDAAVDYLSEAYPDLADYKGKFSPATRMAAIAAAGDIDGYMERTAPKVLGPGSLLVDTSDGRTIASAPFAPRPVTVKEGETVVEYAPGGGSTDDIWRNMIHTESRGRQFGSNGQPLTSSAGAIGIAQVMPGTAPEAARLAGLPFDENRYRTDPAYNEALGRAYFEKQLADFGGDTAKAVAAYNAGPGRVQAAIRKGGDNWTAHLPGETKGYLQSVLGPAGSRVIARGAPKQPASQWRRMTPQEMQEAGLPAGVVYQVSPTGEIKAVSGQNTRSGQQVTLARTKLNQLAAIETQLSRVEKAMEKAEKGGWTGYVLGRVPGNLDEESSVFDKSVSNLAPLIRQLTRVPGEGAMSDYESRLAQAQLPSRTDTPQARRETLEAMRDLINNLRMGYTETIGATPAQAAQPSRQAPARQQAPARNRPSVSNW